MENTTFSHTLIRGAIGKKFVVKHYRYGTVKTNYPNMDNIVASPVQRKRRSIFTEAVAFARSVNNDSLRKKQWKKKNKKLSVFNDAISQYMQNHK